MHPLGCVTVPTTHVSNQRAPEWRVAGEQQHLIIERQTTGVNMFAVSTACGLIITPSQRDIRLNERDNHEDVPRCRSCEVVEADMGDAPMRARLS